MKFTELSVNDFTHVGNRSKLKDQLMNPFHFYNLLMKWVKELNPCLLVVEC